MTMTWQPSLLESAITPTLAAGLMEGASRRFLGAGAWVDTVPGVVTGADALFEEVLAAAPWAEHERPMYDRIVREPRLTTRRWEDPPALILDLGARLTAHYGVGLGIVSANLYRSGADSVAWHGDRVGRVRAETVVAILSLGEARRFLLRPKGGGSSVRYAPLSGDLLVMGGTCQRTWEHTVPKCAAAGPRISVMFREAY
ncbi:MAG TPA: alpha-ketoglutarate-dependent dioxygenase AlkB [Acidimicrobiales bacterium]|nr:alpha-ketoglutarate-dependent dioxygenase AlkB [Acidimicrobiales bacterium]